MLFKILLVEYSERWRNILKSKIQQALKILNAQDSSITICATFDEAWDKLNNSHWDLLISDISMGSTELLGLELIREAKSIGIPRIAVTGNPKVTVKHVEHIYNHLGGIFFSKTLFDDHTFVDKFKELILKNYSYLLEDRASVIQGSTTSFNILCLSDFHFSTAEQANLWSNQLIQDLSNNIKINQIDVLILAGDIANKSTLEEYKTAETFLSKLCRRFPLQPEQIVIVPGNHDLNWEKSKDAYQAVRLEKYDGPKIIGSDGQEKPDPNYTIYDGEKFVEVQDEKKYKQRFAYFRDFYKAIKDEPYPLDYDQQGILHHFLDKKLLILGLNSAWQLDHHYTSRASINMGALANALSKINRNRDYQDCCKIAVWHHPVTGRETMNDDFMQQLTIGGFRVCLHGHIHEAIEAFHKFDDKRGLHIIGAGTFGAPAKEQVTGIPLQYNLLTLDPQTQQLTVRTRKKERINGAWSADARWQDKENPQPWYILSLK